MRSWPALLLSPLLLLGAQSIAYSLTTPACARQNEALLLASLFGCLVLSLVFTLMAWFRSRRLGPVPREDASAERPRFVALVATGVGALSSLVIAAMWIGPLVLSPCSSA
jgi:hypothetical protein